MTPAPMTRQSSSWSLIAEELRAAMDDQPPEADERRVARRHVQLERKKRRIIASPDHGRAERSPRGICHHQAIRAAAGERHINRHRSSALQQPVRKLDARGVRRDEQRDLRSSFSGTYRPAHRAPSPGAHTPRVRGSACVFRSRFEAASTRRAVRSRRTSARASWVTCHPRRGPRARPARPRTTATPPG